MSTLEIAWRLVRAFGTGLLLALVLPVLAVASEIEAMKRGDVE